MKGVGILADKLPRDQWPDFRRFNLVYGFNGSGKSTLSRLFACLQSGRRGNGLPEECTFEVELDNGVSYGTPDALAGLEARVCVFNTDFISQNLRWETSTAASIFYISKEQADLAGELRSMQALLPTRVDAQKAWDSVTREREKTLKGYRTERAKVIAGAIHLVGRRYEASHLQTDYENASHGSMSLLSKEQLDALVGVARVSSPPPPLPVVKDELDEARAKIEQARRLAELSVGRSVLAEFENHPSMVPWIRTGHDYHSAHELQTCLYCGSGLDSTRKEILGAALDDKIATLLADVETSVLGVTQQCNYFANYTLTWPRETQLDPSLQDKYAVVLSKLKERVDRVNALLTETLRVLKHRAKQPTLSVDHNLPTAPQVREICVALREIIVEGNRLIGAHNEITHDFSKRQESARIAIRQHYLQEGQANYDTLLQDVRDGQSKADEFITEITKLQSEIANLMARVKSHGPAAEQITRMVRAYLGHGELTIIAAKEGYELHRHGKLVKGSPSEGEKTAIALSYFLSSLESDGRSIADLIILIDDPISSLDTKAMNYTCSLILSRMNAAGQFFLLTHNQHCMNEFKKAWQGKASPKTPPPTASLLYMDVTMPPDKAARVSRIIEMPNHLRGYDSEYHFLCHKVFQFEAAAEGHSEYWFMMPNVIRRVLEIFLAFKVPGGHAIQQKLTELANMIVDIDPVRMRALERLVQVESHSTSLEDLITQSSMTVEETRDANTALLFLMTKADAGHTAALRKQCRPAP
ncbi:AAA family ATPase [Labrys miyagiensis]